MGTSQLADIVALALSALVIVTISVIVSKSINYLARLGK